MNQQREAEMFTSERRISSLEECFILLNKRAEEIAKLKSELTAVINERDLLLCEVSKLKFELEIADLKSFHDDRVPFMKQKRNTLHQFCINRSMNSSQDCDEEDDNGLEIDDYVENCNEAVRKSSVDSFRYHIWRSGHSKKNSICNNNELAKHIRTETEYELSQDLLDKQIELLERKYGGSAAREAAIIIQRAFRRYMLLKKFAHITAMAKAEKRLSRRIHSYPEHNSNNNNNHVNSAAVVSQSELVPSDMNNSTCCNQQINSTPIRSLSMREKRIAELENGTNSLPRTFSGHCNSLGNNYCGYCNMVTSSSSHMCSSIYSDMYIKGHTHTDLSRNSQSYIHSSSPQNSSLQNYQLCSKRVISQMHYQNSYHTNVSHSQISTPVKKVPPEVPKRTSSISLRGGETNQNTSTCNSDISFGKMQYSGSMSSVQSSSSDSSTAMNTSNSSYNSQQTYTSTPESPWNKKSQMSEIIRKRQYRVGLNLFNKKPEKGIAYLVCKAFLENSPQAVAKFLIARKGLSKQMIGEYLGNVQDPFNSAVLECFAHELDLSGMQVDVALRKFQTYFRMPGEAQKIERLMEVFSHRYCQCNRDVVSRLRSLDTVFVLAFAIIMLNTDLHTPNLKADRRMKLQDFIKNLRGIDDCCDIDRDMLVGIYERIKANEFKPGSDHVSQVMKVQSTIVGKQPNLALPHRRLVCYCRLYEVPDVSKKDRPGLHQREVFLFNDLLVITKILSKKKNSVTYTFRQSLSLSGLTVVVFEAQYYPYGIRLSQRVDNHILVTFNARNEHDRTKFVDDIREAICEMDEMENIRIEAELERQKNGRSNRCNSGSNTENRDSGVADVEVCPCLHTSASGPSVQENISKSYTINEQCTDGRQHRSGSVGSLDSGMSLSFQQPVTSKCNDTSMQFMRNVSTIISAVNNNLPPGSQQRFVRNNLQNKHIP